MRELLRGSAAPVEKRAEGHSADGERFCLVDERVAGQAEAGAEVAKEVIENERGGGSTCI